MPSLGLSYKETCQQSIEPNRFQKKNAHRNSKHRTSWNGVGRTNSTHSHTWNSPYCQRGTRRDHVHVAARTFQIKSPIRNKQISDDGPATEFWVKLLPPANWINTPYHYGRLLVLIWIVILGPRLTNFCDTHVFRDLVSCNDVFLYVYIYIYITYIYVYLYICLCK